MGSSQFSRTAVFLQFSCRVFKVVDDYVRYISRSHGKSIMVILQLTIHKKIRETSGFLLRDKAVRIQTTETKQHLVGGLEPEFYFPYIGKFIILTDEVIFFRGVGIPTNQTCMFLVIFCRYVETLMLNLRVPWPSILSGPWWFGVFGALLSGTTRDMLRLVLNRLTLFWPISLGALVT